MRFLSSTPVVSRGRKALPGVSYITVPQSRLLAATAASRSGRRRWFDGHIKPEDSFSNVGILIVTSDKGLCGGVNTAVLKPTRLLAKELVGQGKNVSIEIIGEKGKSLDRDWNNHIHLHVGDIGKRPMTFLQVRDRTSRGCHSSHGTGRHCP